MEALMTLEAVDDAAARLLAFSVQRPDSATTADLCALVTDGILVARHRQAGIRFSAELAAAALEGVKLIKQMAPHVKARKTAQVMLQMIDVITATIGSTSPIPAASDARSADLQPPAEPAKEQCWQCDGTGVVQITRNNEFRNERCARCQGHGYMLAEAAVQPLAVTQPWHELLEECQAALDVLAGDIADTFPTRSEATADLAMRVRAALRPTGTETTERAASQPGRRI